jgi:hypothetical protein
MDGYGVVGGLPKGSRIQCLGGFLLTFKKVEPSSCDENGGCDRQFKCIVSIVPSTYAFGTI